MKQNKELKEHLPLVKSAISNLMCQACGSYPKTNILLPNNIFYEALNKKVYFEFKEDVYWSDVTALDTCSFLHKKIPCGHIQFFEENWVEISTCLFSFEFKNQKFDFAYQDIYGNIYLLEKGSRKPYFDKRKGTFKIEKYDCTQLSPHIRSEIIYSTHKKTILFDCKNSLIDLRELCN